MQQEAVIFERYLKKERKTVNFGVRSWLASFFGCQHKEMSRPFSRQGETYRVCLACGGRRQFIANTWETCGPVYFSDANAQTGEVISTAIKPRRVVPRPKLLKTVA